MIYSIVSGNKGNSIFYAITYVGLLLFFAHIGLISDCIIKDTENATFLQKFIQYNSNPLIWIDNFGLLLMLMIDYKVLHEKIDTFVWIENLLIIFCLLFVVVYSVMYTDPKYLEWVKWEGIPILCLSIFICGLVHLKYLAINSENVNPSECDVDPLP